MQDHKPVLSDEHILKVAEDLGWDLDPQEAVDILALGKELLARYAVQAVPEAALLTLTRTLGMRGEAFDPPGPHRAYTYEQQPGNIGAYLLGVASNATAKRTAGDSIDRGLALLQELQAVGFGVFQIEPSDAPPSTCRTAPDARRADALHTAMRRARQGEGEQP